MEGEGWVGLTIWDLEEQEGGEQSRGQVGDVVRSEIQIFSYAHDGSIL